MRKCERFVVDGGLTQTPTAAQIIEEGYEELSLDKLANFGKDGLSYLTACGFANHKKYLNSADIF